MRDKRAEEAAAIGPGILDDDFKWETPAPQPEVPGRAPSASNPAGTYSKPPSKANSIYIGIIVVCALFIGGMNLWDRVSPHLGGAREAAVFNVPAIIGLDINGVRANLGTSTDSEDQSTLPDAVQTSYSGESWVRGDTELYIEYDRATGKVLQLFIPVPANGSASDIQTLLDKGGLEESSASYTTEPVAAAGSPGEYTGLKIVPR